MYDFADFAADARLQLPNEDSVLQYVDRGLQVSHSPRAFAILWSRAQLASALDAAGPPTVQAADRWLARNGITSLSPSVDRTANGWSVHLYSIEDWVYPAEKRLIVELNVTVAASGRLQTTRREVAKLPHAGR